MVSITASIYLTSQALPCSDFPPLRAIGNDKQQSLTGSVAPDRQWVAPVTCGTVQMAVTLSNEVPPVMTRGSCSWHWEWPPLTRQLPNMWACKPQAVNLHAATRENRFFFPLPPKYQTVAFSHRVSTWSEILAWCHLTAALTFQQTDKHIFALHSQCKNISSFYGDTRCLMWF